MKPLPLICLIFFVAVAASAGETAAGHWRGSVAVQQAPLPVEVELALTSRGWRGRISFPSQEVRDLPLERVDVTDGVVRFQVAGIPGKPTFVGKFADDAIDGTYTQDGATFALKLSRAAATAVK